MVGRVPAAMPPGAALADLAANASYDSIKNSALSSTHLFHRGAAREPARPIAPCRSRTVGAVHLAC